LKIVKNQKKSKEFEQDISDGDMELEQSITEENCSGIKICGTCKTTDTPLWRKGPSGTKTLCNACGIRWIRSQRRSKRKPDAPYTEKNIQKKEKKLKKQLEELNMEDEPKDEFQVSQITKRIPKRKSYSDDEEESPEGSIKKDDKVTKKNKGDQKLKKVKSEETLYLENQSPNSVLI